jgi:hypothetical protein
VGSIQSPRPFAYIGRAWLFVSASLSQVSAQCISTKLANVGSALKCRVTSRRRPLRPALAALLGFFEVSFREWGRGIGRSAEAHFVPARNPGHARRASASLPINRITSRPQAQPREQCGGCRAPLSARPTPFSLFPGMVTDHRTSNPANTQTRIAAVHNSIIL